MSQYNQIFNACFSDGLLQKHWVCLKVRVSSRVVVDPSKGEVKLAKYIIDCGKKLLSRNTRTIFILFHIIRF